MKRVLIFAVMFGFPLAAAAQTPPTPPVPPATPQVRPAPPAPPAPRVVVPEFYGYAVEEAMRAAQAARVDARAVEEAMEQARAAVESVHVGELSALEHMRWELQDRAFVFSQDANDAGYSTGMSLLGRRQFEQAIARFDRVVAQKGTRADAALYWKAYAQFKLGRTEDALAAITQLRRDFAQSRYINDAKVLESDVRKMAGQPVNPDDIVNEDIKLLAIQGIQNSDPERAIPLLEGVLNATNSLNVKKRALFVLAQSSQPRARQILMNYAKGAGTPDLQMEAIRYLNSNRERRMTSAELRDIYQSTQDLAVRSAIIWSHVETGGRAPMLLGGVSGAVAGTAVAPVAVRPQPAGREAANAAAAQELWALYEKETNKDLRMQIVSAFGSLQAFDQLNQVLRSEKDPEVRRRAVRSLGSLRSDKTGQMLVDIYANEQDVDTRKAVISALGSQNNAEGLVAIARKEASLELKRSIVQKLSEMAPRSKVAADYLMEIIK